MEVLAILMIVLGVVGLIVTVVTLFIRETRPAGPAVGVVVAVVCFVLAAVFGGTYYHNHFYSLHEEYNTSRANVGVMDEKAGILQGELLTLLDIYIGHEERLIAAVENRNTSSLRALFERYPRLMASANVQQVTNKYIVLIDDVARAKLTANAVGRAFNTSNRVIPASWFAPGDLPDSLPMYDIPESRE